MEIKQLGLQDRIRLHPDWSWERRLSYTDHEGVTRELCENGTATLVKANKRTRVLKFEPFTFVFESLVPIHMTYARKPSKTLNLTMGLRRERREWLLELNSEYGYEYHRIKNVSDETEKNEVATEKNEMREGEKRPDSVDERLDRIKRAFEKPNPP